LPRAPSIEKRFLDLLKLHMDRGRCFAPATPQKWTYKAIFRDGDQRVGQWSDEVSIIIGG